MARKVYSLLMVALLSTGAMAGPSNGPPKYKYPNPRPSYGPPKYNNQVSPAVQPKEADDLSAYSSKCDLLFNHKSFSLLSKQEFINDI